jgi:hypothetical protein
MLMKSVAADVPAFHGVPVAFAGDYVDAGVHNIDMVVLAAVSVVVFVAGVPDVACVPAAAAIPSIVVIHSVNSWRPSSVTGVPSGQLFFLPLLILAVDNIPKIAEGPAVAGTTIVMASFLLLVLFLLLRPYYCWRPYCSVLLASIQLPAFYIM